MRKKKRGIDVVYCPFMTNNYSLPFLFFGLFGFGSINPKEQPCLSNNCAVWNPEHKVCSFRLIDKLKD